MDTPVLSRHDFKADAGERLRKLLQLMNLRQTEAARIMGVSKNVLRNWLAGDNPVQAYPLYRLCRVKGIDFNYVFLGDWSRLPAPLARALEDELLTKLERPRAIECLAGEKA